ncbi:putative GTPase [Encephalitozoon hellem ATCC 50504]|uniref:Ribosome biogenesis GTPase A n=1 Tax=Encephalitozoon hellem TaxID=27973 RepID=A0A9Q9C3X4_ENCHE|nr:putative GTPase [Encephalitozoon hellem ATCC 50504]AFM98730.1 putative GTPase [Encephalitozoon hellem ATCC 50504]UTX43706.1 ribosome biogenesis GTPase A [Encephalitozoon hellem]|eukprot:XP_003887711.1 putative GTPase [Encephalitozoon hellem ATCC 50504]
MGIKKKRQSKRLTTRKRESMLKRARINERKKRRLNRKMQKKMEKVPPSVLRTDEENMQYAEIKRMAKLRKIEYDEALKNSERRESYLEEMMSMVSKSDVVFEVIDARDPDSSRNSEAEKIVSDHGKKLVMVLNYTQYVPRGVVNEWKDYLKKDGKICVELMEGEIEWIGKETRIGIFGNPRSGKNSVLQRITKALGEKPRFTIVSVPPSKITLSNVLRGCHELVGMPFRSYIDVVVERIDRSEISLRHGIPEFSSTEELLESICDENGIDGSSKCVRHMKACERFLEDFSQHKILFWRGVNDGENDLSFAFPS